MHVMDLSHKTQDYLKAIFDLHEWNGQDVSLSALSTHLGQNRSTTSEAVKKLTAAGLVDHRPYSDIRLTEDGRRLALAMVRRHRLIETYLHHDLGYSLVELHDEAEILEHAVSDTFLARIDDRMGHPTRDPHGDPIPLDDGTLAPTDVTPIDEVAFGTPVVIDRISDRNPDLLTYLERNHILPGERVSMHHHPHPDLVLLRHEKTGSEITLPLTSLPAILCQKQSPTSA